MAARRYRRWVGGGAQPGIIESAIHWFLLSKDQPPALLRDCLRTGCGQRIKNGDAIVHAGAMDQHLGLHLGHQLHIRITGARRGGHDIGDRDQVHVVQRLQGRDCTAEILGWISTPCSGDGHHITTNAAIIKEPVHRIRKTEPDGEAPAKKEEA